ncbi:hypothetical protein MPER_07989 [Moniliophthora perniciosa FA553]|nr:hypothetical protein MPER_07989 [Moniliophthora perniciosa FA553]
MILLPKVVLRIALCPMVSLIVNTATVTIGIVSNRSGFDTKRDHIVMLVGNVTWIIQLVAYSLLAATDPALLRGLRAIRESRRHSQSGSYANTILSPIPVSAIGQLTEITTDQMNGVIDTTFDKTDGTHIPLNAARGIDPEHGVVPPPFVRVILSRNIDLEERQMVEIGKHL